MDRYLTCRGKATWVSHTYACAQPQGRIQRGVGALPTPTRSIGKREKRMREEKGNPLFGILDPPCTGTTKHNKRYHEDLVRH